MNKRAAKPKPVTITPHLGTGPEGHERKATLTAIAKRAGFIWNGEPSIGRWLCALADKGDTKPPLAPLSDTQLIITEHMFPGELDDLEDAILIQRQKIMADRLTANGFEIATPHKDGGVWLNYFLVINPTGDGAVYADLAECRVLLDTVRNLPPAEAFARWRSKVKPMEDDC